MGVPAAVSLFSQEFGLEALTFMAAFLGSDSLAVMSLGSTLYSLMLCLYIVRPGCMCCECGHCVYFRVSVCL